MSGRKTAAVMQRDSGVSGSTNTSSADSNAVARTTVVFPASLNANLEVFALSTGRTKNEVLTDITSKYLRSKGFNPDKYPKVKVSYEP